MKSAGKILALLMAAVIAGTICFALSACGSENEGSTTATSFHSGNEYAKTDFDKVEKSIEDNNTKVYKAFMKDVLAGKYDNKVVEIEGTNTLYGDCAGILQKQKDGINVGAMYYIINSTFPNDYPEKGAKIRLRGLVVVNETNDSRHLEVSKDYLEIL